VGSADGKIQAELVVVMGGYLAALNQAQAAMAKFAQGAGSGMAPVNQAAQESTSAVQKFAAASATGAQSYISDQRMQGRQASFLAAEILDVGLAGRASGESLKAGLGLGIEALSGLRTGLNGIAIGMIAFEAVKFAVAIVRQFGEAAKVAAEEAKHFGEQVSAALTKSVDKLDDLLGKDKKDSDKTGDKLDAAVSMRDRNVRRLADLEAELAAINEKYLSDVAAMGEGAGPGTDTRVDSAQAKAMREEIAKLRAIVATTGATKGIELDTERTAREGLINASREKGNPDYEMTGGDGGVLLASKTLAAVHAKFAQMSAEADLSIAKAGHATAEQLEQLRLKSEVLALNAQLAAAGGTAEEAAIRRAIAAAKAASLDRMRDLRIGKSIRDNANESDWMDADVRRIAHDEKDGKVFMSNPSNWAKEAQTADETNKPGAFGDAGLASATMVKTQIALANQLRDSWSTVGTAMGGAFSALGAAVGGSLGKILSQIGQVISQLVSMAIATQGSLPFPWNIVAMAATGTALVAGMIAANSGVPSYDVGTYSVPRTGLALVHQGEAILPVGGPAEAYRAGSGGGGGNVSVVFNAPVDRDWWAANRTHIVEQIREATRDRRL
jgi:hypothetical protein